MTGEEMIRLAREAGVAGVTVWDAEAERYELAPELKCFADLIAAAVRNRTWTQDHWTEYERAIVAAEREACAKVCEAIARDTYGMNNLREYGECAAAIRARGQAS